MWGHMALQMGASVVQHGMSFIAASKEAASKRKWQVYNNAMTRIADGQNQNAITTNQNMAVGRSTVQQFEIERSEYTTRAQVETAAAVAGTGGRSVNQTMFQVDRNAAVAQRNRLSDLQAQLDGFDNQRRTSAFQAAQQIDYTYIPSPSPVTAMLGLGGDLSKIYNQFNPTK